MRLLMEVQDSDGFTYSCTVTFHIVHESPEAALVELEQLVMKAAQAQEMFEFGGHTLTCDWFVYWDEGEYTFFAPSFYTVDEFFAEVEK